MADFGGFNIKFDRVTANYLFHTVNGPVGREKRRKAKQIQFRARQLAPKGMRSQIVIQNDGIAEAVVSKHPATLFVIRGTKRHFIRKGKAPGKMLKFDWHGKTVFFRWVDHPGTKANDFLIKAMREVRDR